MIQRHSDKGSVRFDRRHVKISAQTERLQVCETKSIQKLVLHVALPQMVLQKIAVARLTQILQDWQLTVKSNFAQRKSLTRCHDAAPASRERFSSGCVRVGGAVAALLDAGVLLLAAQLHAVAGQRDAQREELVPGSHAVQPGWLDGSRLCRHHHRHLAVPGLQGPSAVSGSKNYTLPLVGTFTF